MNKTILLILDGFGLRNEEKGNAVKLAHTPYIDKYMAQYPNTTLEASGEAVGLPKGEMGNSEVGHLTLGAGRKINQPLSIINESIDKKEFYENKEIISVLEHVNKYDSALHIMGLLSDGGIHSSIKHFYSTLALAKLYEVKKDSLSYLKANFYFLTISSKWDEAPNKSPRLHVERWYSINFLKPFSLSLFRGVLM